MNQGKEARIYFYRDRSQYEVDLLWQKGRELVPMEIKYSQTYKKEFTKNLKYFKEISKDRVSHGCVIYTGESSLTDKENNQWLLINYRDLSIAMSSH